MGDVNVYATKILIYRCTINFPLRPQTQSATYYWTYIYGCVLHKIVSLIYLNLIIPQKNWLNQKIFHTIEDKQVTISFFDLKIEVKKRINES